MDVALVYAYMLLNTLFGTWLIVVLWLSRLVVGRTVVWFLTPVYKAIFPEVVPPQVRQ